MVLKYGHLILPGTTFSEKVTPDIDFIDEAVVPYYGSVIKVLLQVLVIYK